MMLRFNVVHILKHIIASEYSAHQLPGNNALIVTYYKDILNKLEWNLSAQSDFYLMPRMSFLRYIIHK